MFLSEPCYQKLSYPRSLISSPYFTYIGNTNELIHDVSVPMVFVGNEFLGIKKTLLAMELFIFLSSEKHLIWNLACAIRREKSLFSN